MEKRIGYGISWQKVGRQLVADGKTGKYIINLKKKNGLLWCQFQSKLNGEKYNFSHKKLKSLQAIAELDEKREY